MKWLRPPGGRLSILLGFGTAAVTLGQGSATPVLPEYTLGFGVSAIGLAAAVAVFALGRMIITIPTGVVAHRFPPRVVLTLGCAVTALGVIGCGLAPTFSTLLAFRALGGIGSGIYLTSAVLTIVAHSPVRRRATRIGFNQSALVAAVTVGPALGGILGETTGLRASFVIVGAIAAVGAVVTWTGWNWAARSEPDHDRSPDPVEAGEGSEGGEPREGGTRPDDATAADREQATATDGKPDQPGASGLERIMWPAFITACAVNFAIFATRHGARQTILPLIAVEQFSLSVGSMGALFTMMSIVSLVVLPAASWAGDRFGRIPTIVPGLVATAGGLAVAAFAGSLPGLWIGAAVMSAGMSMASPTPMAWAADASPAPRHGVTLAVARTAGDVGSFIGPLALAAVAIAATLGVSLLTNGLALLVLAGLTVATGLRRRRGRSSQGGSS